MPSPATIDFDRLLAPLPGDPDTGIDLRKDPSKPSPYWRIKALRNTSRVAEATLAKGEVPDQPADWKGVLAQAEELLTHKSKDLEIVTYVIEALVRVHGVSGLRDGFRLARELVERYWDRLYPDPQLEEGVVDRVAALGGLGGDSEREGALIGPIGQLPLADSRSQGRLPFSKHVEALALERMPESQAEARQRKIADGAMSLEKLSRAAADTPADFFRQQLEDVTDCLDEFGRMTEALDQRCSLDSPASTTLRETLEAYRGALDALGGAKVKATTPVGDDRSGPDGNGQRGSSGGPGLSGPVRSREEALECLLRVAEFFRRTEPHSFLYYNLEQAVRWGRTPLPELLAELIPDDAARDGLFRRVGIKPPGHSESETRSE